MEKIGKEVKYLKCAFSHQIKRFHKPNGRLSISHASAILQ